MAENTRKRDWSRDRQAVKALVAVYGPREAARQSGIPLGTITGWCFRYKWKKAAFIPKTTGINGDKPPAKDAAQMIIDALQNHRDASTLHLAEYAAKAAKAASKHGNPLEIARKVRDVAGVHQIVFPKEEGNELIEGAILIGAARVVDDTDEMLAMTKVEQHITDVREEVSDQRPAGD